MPMIYDNHDPAAVIAIQTDDLSAREMIARGRGKIGLTAGGRLAEKREPEPVIARAIKQGEPSRPVKKTGVATRIFDMAGENGPALVEMDEALASDLLERFGDRFTRSPPSRLVIYDLEYPDGHGASAVQMWATDAWNAHRSNPARYVWALPRGVHPHSDRSARNPIIKA